MIDNKKEQERDELHRAIWAIADGLRGAKSYVLGMMFYRYISENLTNYINEAKIEISLFKEENASAEGERRFIEQKLTSVIPTSKWYE